MQGIDRRSQKYDSVEYRDDCPDTCKNLPVCDSESTEEDRGDQNDSHMSPAIKRMQKAHCFFFVVCRAGLDDRADQYLQKSAADRVDRNCDQNAGKRIFRNFREDCQCKQADRRTNMCDRYRCLISYLIYKAG